MDLKAVQKSFIVFLTVFGVVFSCTLSTSTTSAQDDPNAQYITIISGDLSNEPREIEVPVEVGVFRLQLSVQFNGELNLAVITPTGKPLVLSEPNINVIETKERRLISMWDPRPGKWKLRISGSGRFTAAATAQGELYVCCLQFYGRNGIYMLDRFQPARGSRQQAQVFASGFNLHTIEFNLITEQGGLIAPLKFRQSEYSNPSSFTLFVETPEQPFRVLARGRDTNGKGFQRVFHWLIRPNTTDTSNAQGENPPVVTSNNQALQELNKDANEGEQKIIRAQVVKWSDETLFSEKGNPIGVRLKYSMRFPVEGSYSPAPQLYPERVGSAYTESLTMRIYNGTIEPLPLAVQSQGQLIIGVRATFKPQVIYSFTVDLIPNYAIYNEQKKSFCLQTKLFGQQGIRERFAREVMTELKVRFRLSITGTDIDGRLPALTENTYMPAVWFQGFLREGITDCQ
ncbi:MAG: hypothetical protein L0226_00775 [Acidobacteria bacterium]|nr:hypothetical protein [Acidobacteriota bacterium]